MSANLPPRGACFLLVDDDPRIRDRLAQALRDRGYRARVAAGPSEALAAMAEEPAGWVLLDMRMPGGDGLSLIPELKKLLPSVRIVVLSGYGSISNAVDAVRLGAVGYLLKPADADMVLAAFARAEAGPQLDAAAAVAPYEPPSLDFTEWEHIQRVLTDCGGNISQAAKKLGLHRRTLQRKLDREAPRR